MRKGAKAVIVGSVFAVMVGGAGYGTYNIVSALQGRGRSGPAGRVKTGPPCEGRDQRRPREVLRGLGEGPGAGAPADLTDNAAARDRADRRLQRHRAHHRREDHPRDGHRRRPCPSR